MTFWRSILMLRCRLCLGFPSCLFPPGFPNKTLHAHLLTHIRAICPGHLIRLDLNVRIVFGKEWKIMKNFVYYVNKHPTRCNSMQIFIYCKVTLNVSSVRSPIIRSAKNCNRSLRYRLWYWYSYFPSTWPDRAMLEGSSCTSNMTCNGGCGYSF